MPPESSNSQLDRIEKKLADVEVKLDAVLKSSEKMRKYFLWTLIITAAVIIIPLFILPLLLPAFLNSVTLLPGV